MLGVAGRKMKSTFIKGDLSYFIIEAENYPRFIVKFYLNIPGAIPSLLITQRIYLLGLVFGTHM